MVLPGTRRKLEETMQAQIDSGMQQTPETARYLALHHYHNIPFGPITGGKLSDICDYIEREHGPVPVDYKP